MTKRLSVFLFTFFALFAPTMSAAQNPPMTNATMIDARAQFQATGGCGRNPNQADFVRGAASADVCSYSAGGVDYGHVSDWNVSQVTDMEDMFNSAGEFNQDISAWNVSNVTNMRGMFQSAANFNQDIGDWTVSNVEDMTDAFESANAFNADISGWDVSGVKNMRRMFQNAHAFNQNIGGWDVSNVTNMGAMFTREILATDPPGTVMALDQDIRDWTVGNSVNLLNMFANNPAMIARFDGVTGFGNSGNGYTPTSVFFNQGDVSTLDGFTGVTTTETFVTSTTSYTATATAGALTLGIDLSRPRGTASVVLTQGGSTSSVTVGDPHPVTGEAALSDFTIASGTNVFDITVTSPASTSLTTPYTLTVTGEGNPAMTDGIFAAALADSNYITNCLNASDQFSVSKRGTSSSSCVYTDGSGTNYGHISDWNTADVTDMGGDGLGPTTVLPANFNQDIRGWDVSSVTNMANLFSSGKDTTSGTAFSQDISGWDVSSVKNMAHMFRGAASFNADIGGWNTASVTDMWAMFNGATSFNADIGDWTTTAVTSTRVMFQGTDFNQDISRWDVSNVTHMNNMFKNNDDFNQDISGWDVSSVEYMQQLFAGASAFDQDIRDWDTGSVTSIGYDLMFNTSTKMIARFGPDGTTPVDSFDADGNPSNGYTPSLAFFKQGGVSTLDGFIGVTTTETFTSASTSYSATATLGTLDLSIDLSRPRGTASVVLTQGSSTSSVTVGTPNPVTGVAALSDFTIASGTNVFDITVTSPSGTASTSYTLTVTGEGNPAMTDNIFAAALADSDYITACLNASDQLSVGKGGGSSSSCVYFKDGTNYGHISDWNTADVTDMGGDGLGPTTVLPANFNQDIRGWDVSSVTNMANLFSSGKDTTSGTAFSQDISDWDVSSVKNMAHMFRGAASFNADIGGWNTASVTDMWAMFNGATSFNADIGDWTTTAVTSTRVMFQNTKFNQDISDWDVSNVTHMNNMFKNNGDFNQDISGWDVSSVEYMNSLFAGASAFDQDIRDWDTGSVIVTATESNYYRMFNTSTKMIARFGATGTTPVASFDLDPDSDVTPSAAFFNQGGVSTLDRFIGVTTTETFTSASTSYSATATLGTLDLSIDLSRPRGTASVVLTQGGSTSVVTVGAIDPVTGEADLASVNIASGTNVFDITVTSPDASASSTYTLSVTGTAPVVAEAGIEPSADTLTVAEGSTTTFTVQLGSAPTASVTVTPSVSDASEVRFSPATLTFTTGDWNATQTVTVAGVFDTITDGTQTSTLTLTASSADGNYSGITRTVAVTTTHVATTTPAAMDDPIFDRAVTDATYRTNCLNESTQGNVAKGVASAHHCVYYEGTTNYGHISDWNTSAVTDMDGAFNGRSNFNQNISNWNTASVTTFANMFNSASAFNQPIGSWDTDSLQNMSTMFQNATLFNQPLGDWDTSNVTNMFSTFKALDGATVAFNQDISGWDTASVTDFKGMFARNAVFDQDIRDWNVSNSASLDAMFQVQGSGAQAGQSAMRAHFSGTTGYGSAANNYTPSHTFFNQVGVSTLDGFIGVTTTETFTSASTSYSATATPGTLDLSIDLSRPRGTASVVLTQGSSTSSVTVGDPHPVTGEAALSDFNIAAGSNVFSIIVTSPDASASSTYTLSVTGTAPVVAEAGIEPSADTLTVAEGSTTTFTVQLGSAPTSSVTVTPSASDASEVRFSPATLSFTTGDWDTPQTVTVVGVYDAFADGTQTSTLTLTASSTDGDYSDITSTVAVTTTDVATPTVAVMNNGIFNAALADSDYITACLDATNQGAVRKRQAGASACVYYEGTTNYGHISDWNTADVTDMGGDGLGPTTVLPANFNQDIRGWDVSSVTNMANLFSSGKDTTSGTAFSQDISDWDVSSVKNMAHMFRGAASFNADIGGWNTASVTDMWAMFNGATSFNADIGDWTTTAVTSTRVMFQNTKFNQDISDWDVSNVTHMNNMFKNNGDFNQDISGWDVSSVEYMNSLFAGASAFDQDIRDWDTGSVIVTATESNYYRMFNTSTKMIARFGATGTTPVASFDLDPDSDVTPSAAFFNQGGVSTLDRFIGVTTTETFTSASTSYSATATLGTLDLSIDLSRPRGTASVVLTQGGSTSVVTVGAIDPVTGEADLASVNIASGTNVFDITVTSPDASASSTYTLSVTGTAPVVAEAGIEPSADTLTVAEGSTTTFTVQLGSAPTASVTVTPSVSDASEVRFSPATLTFTTGDWNATQTVTVAGVFDTITDGTQTSTLTLTASSADGNYSGITRTVAVTTTHVATTTPAAMDDPIFDRAVTDATYRTNCLNESTQGNVAKGVASAHHCVYYEGTTNYGHISDWNTSAVTDMDGAFNGRSNFNQNISNWNTASVTTFANMFNSASAFNQPIGSWDTDSLQNMSTMFQNATLFNQPLGDWDTSNVTNMFSTFKALDGATVAFNQDISGWDTASVTDFNGMFARNAVFDQDIRDWNVSNSASLDAMFQVQGSGAQAGQSAMRAHFSGTTGYGSAANNYTPSHTFFNQVGVSTLDGFIGVTTTETFTSASTSYSATATPGTLDLSIDLSRPRGTASVVLTQGSSTSSVTVGDPHPVTGEAALSDFNIAAGSNVFSIIVTSPDASASSTYTLSVTGTAPVVAEAGIEPSADTLTVAEGSTTTFTVQLGSAPTSSVTVTPSASDASEVRFSPATLSFTTGDWDTPQTVTVVGVYDAFADGTQTSTLTLTASSTDGDYSDITSTVAVTTTDVATPTVAVMNNGIFNAALADSDYITACLDATNQGAVRKRQAGASACVYYEGTTNYGHISDWNTADVTDMGGDGLGPTTVLPANFNQDIRGWDVSSVTNMANLFSSGKDTTSGTAFSQDISDWDVSSVKNMAHMFRGAASFNADIGGWNTASVTDMWAMFNGATSFNADIGDWTTTAVTSTRVMFQNTKFNQDISRWDVSNVTHMNNMFKNNYDFNQDISGWDVSSVEYMQQLFAGASAFDQDIRDWDTGSVTSIGYDLMFNTSTKMIARFGPDGTTPVDSFDTDGNPSNGYTPSLAFFKQGGVSTLDGITTVASSSGATSSVVLSPRFAANTLSYTGSISAGDAMALTLDLARPNSTVTVNYGGNIVATSSNVDVDGTLSFAFSNVASGDGNVFTITVTSPDGTSSKTYTLTMTGIAVVDTSSRTVVFPLMGQSNMQGRDTFDNGAEYPAGTLQYNQSSALVPATSPLNHFPLNQISGSMGLALQFTIDYKLANPNHTVVLVPLAVPGTGFGDSGGASRWGVGEALYNIAVTRINQLFAANPGFELGAFLWHQGEFDINATSTYIASLTAQIAGMRDEVTAASETTPYIVGGIFNGDATRSAMTDLIATVPGLVSYTAFAPSTGLSDIDDEHFDAASLRTLGSRYYTALGRAAEHVVSPAPAIVTSAGSLTVAEGSTTTFTVSLGSAPTSSVTVTPSAGDASEVRFSPATLSFTTGNWNTPQTVTVAGVYDTITDGTQTSTLTLTASSADGNYSGITRTVAVTTTHVATTTPAAMDDPIFDRAVTDATYRTNCLNESTQGNVAKGVASAHHCVYYEGTTNYGHISDWNTSAVTDMDGAFNGRSNFNQNISNWNTASVTTFANMFNSASAFNQPIGSWDTDSLQNMSMMFQNATLFNQPLGDWDTSNVTNMFSTFKALDGATVAFNQDISGWDTASVTDFKGMFARNAVFYQDIRDWNVSNSASLDAMFQVQGSGAQAGQSAMRDRFSGTTGYVDAGTPLSTFFNQASVSALDGITAVANSSGATSSVMLSPGFASNTLSYAGSVSAGNAMALTLDLARPNSTVTVNYGGSTVATSSNVGVDGTLSFAFSNVASGNGNVFTITVTSPDGTSSKRYTVTMTGIAVEDTSSKTVVFPLIGQSNMVGRDTFDNGAEYPAGTLQYNRAGNLIAATSPLSHVGRDTDPDTGTGARTNQMGLALQFTIDYKLAYPNHTVVLVPLADGATSFREREDGRPRWGVGETLYNTAVNHINQLFTENSSFELGAFLWHQGESDWDATSTYVASLTAQIAGMRDEVDDADETTPYILGGLSSDSSIFDDVAGLIETIPDLVSYTAFAPSTGLTTVGDNVHFDAASLRTLGARYYTALGRAAGNVVTSSLASIVTSPTSVTVAEGSTTTFTVQLGSAPTASVTVIPSASDASEVRFSPATLTFTTGDWNATQTVTVAGVFDTITDGTQTSTLTLTASSADGNYSGITRTVAVTTTHVATTTPAAMDDPIFDRAVTDATYRTNCLNESTQGNVAKGVASAHHCVYYEGTTNYGHISDWNTSAVTDMDGAFNGRSNFNQNISNWNTASVTTFANMFNSASAFNQPIGSWDTDSLQNMSMMFQNATLFNQPLGDWDTSNVTNMFSTFKALDGATVAFNQDISGWDTASVTDFKGMFARNAVFDQDIRDWNVSNSASLDAMFQVQGSGAQAGQSAMRAHFSGTTGYVDAGTPLSTFFNQASVSALDGITAVASSSGATSSVTLSPSFDGSTLNYSAALSPSNDVALTLNLARPNSAVTVTYAANEGASSDIATSSNTDANGVVSFVFSDLAVGTNVFTITVTSPDGTASTPYTVTLNSAFVSLSTASTSVTEANTTVAFTLTQDFPLETTTTVAYAIGGTATAGMDYSTPETGTVDIAKGATTSVLNVALINDAVAESAETIVVTLTGITQGDAVLSATDTATTTVNDDDVARFDLSPSSLAVAEGATSSFTIALSTQPTADVTVSVTSGDSSEVGLSSSSVVFTSSTWNTPKTIIVMGETDTLVDGTQAAQITLVGSSTDSNYHSSATGNVDVSVTDVSVGTIELSSSSLSITEGATTTFTVKLGVRPTEDVTVTISSDDVDDEASFSTTSVVFTSSTWNDPQTITVTGVTDTLVDGDQGYSIDLSASSGLSGYDDVTSSLAATTTDVDEAKLSISTASPSLTEASTTVTFTVTQSTVATQSTIVVYSLGGTAVFDLDYTGEITGSVTIGAGATSSSFTVQLLDDDVADGNKTLTATLSSITSGMATIGSPASSNIVITDNESPGFDLSVSSLTVAEGATSSFTIALNTQPTQDVTVSVTSNDASEVSLSSGSVVFTSVDWNTPKTITVMGETDTLVDGTQVAQITLVGSSTDSNYHSSATGSVDVSVTDMNVGTLVLSSSSLSIEEGATTTFTVKLGVRPTEDVTVTISSDDIDDEASFSPTSVVFTSANWNDPQTITVTAANDTLVDGDQGYSIDLTASSDLSGYDDVTSSLAATTSDVSVGTLVLSTSSLSVAEGATTTFTVKLGLRPTQDVTVSVISSDSSEATLSTTSVVFTSANWDDPQTITVTGVTDNLVDGDQGYSIDLSASSGLSGYEGVSRSLAATTTDVDEAKLRISTASSSLTEASTTVSFTVTQSAVATQSTIVVYSLGGTVSAGSDYTGAATGSVTIGAGATSSSFTVQLLDDNVADGNKTLIATLNSITSGMATIGSPASSNIVITDNETPGFELSVSSLTVAEGATSSFTIALNTQPTQDVTVSVTSGDSSEVGLSSGSVVFTSVDWNTPKTITVMGETDTLVDGTQVAQITLVGSSTDSNYHSSATGNVDVSVTDVSVGSLVLSPSSLSVAEGATATFTVKLGVRPTQNVTVTISSDDVDDEASFSTTSVVFTSANWDDPQTITVTGVADNLVDGDQGYSIDLSASSGLSGYDDVTSSLAATTTDVDEAKLRISTASSSLTEASTTVSFTVTQSAVATQSTIVVYSLGGTVSAGSDYTGAATGSVTIGAGATSSSFTVQLLDDNVADGNKTLIATLSSITSGMATIGSPASSNIVITDNETPGLELSVSSLTVAEGATSSFTIALNTQPTQDVTVSVTSGDSSEVGLSSGSVVFTSVDWNTPKKIIVTGVADTLVDGTQVAQITLVGSSTDSNYHSSATGNVDVSVTDVSVGSLVLSPSSLSVAEGSTATFTVKLGLRPTQDVTVSVISSDSSEATLSTTSVVFTSANWDDPQTITVTGVADNLVDGDQGYSIDLSASSGLSGYDDVTSSLAATTTDVDEAKLSISTASPSVTEASTTVSFTVTQSAVATQSTIVVYSLGGTVSAGSDYTGAATGSVTIGAGATSSSFTVQLLDDNVADGNKTLIATLSSITSGMGQLGSPVSSNIVITDNETPGLDLSDSSLTVAEGATSSFTIALNTQPTADVTVSVTSGDSSEVSLSSGSVVFTSVDWNTPKTIIVTGVADTLVDGDQSYSIDLSASSADNGYNNVTSSIAATTSDVDEANLSISTASPSVTEASATVTFTVTQSAPATVNTQVEYQITGTASAGSDYIGTATGSVTIGAGATSSSFSRQILHDLVAEGDETLIVTLTSISAGASSVSIGIPSSVTVTIRDNDDPGLSVSVSSLTLTEGASSSFTVVLDTQPEADVTVNLISSDSDASEGRLSESRLIFTAGNWNTAQTITLSAVEEDVADGDQSYTITLTGSSTDPNYHNVSSSIAAMTTDDDTAGTTLSRRSLSLAEGSSGSFTVVLTSEPTSDVTFTVNSSDVAGEASFSTTSVVFTNANWDTAQTITVSATADNLVDGDQGYTITLTGSSADSNYDSIGVDVSATTTDVDSATVSLSSGPASTTESTSTLLYTVTLSTASDATTTLSYTISGSMTAGADYEGSDAGSVSIAPRASTGTIAVTLIDDDDVEGPEQMTVRLEAITASVGSISLGTPLSVSTEVSDNDAGVVVLEDKVKLPEGETTTVSVKLSTQPENDVTVTVSSTRLKEASSGPSSVLSFGARPFSSVELTFTPLNWNVPQEVEVTAEGDDDDVVDGDEEFEITLNAQSEDDEYEGVTSTVEAEVLDTDTAEIMTSVSSISVSEAGTTTFTVELTSRPSGEVTVSVVSSDTSEGTVSPASLTFPAADWNTPQTVTLTGSAADDIADGSKDYTLTLTAASTDANFNGVATSVAATTLDTDASFISIAAPSNVSVSEATSTARLTIVQSVVSDQNTVIRYSLGGSATLGTDYTGPSVASGTVTIAAGATSTVFSITTSEDTAPEGDETIIFMLTSISSGVPTLGSPVQGVITIEDNDDIPSSEIEKDIESLIKAASEVLIATTPPVIAFIDAPSTGLTVGGPQGGTNGSGFSGETTVNVKAKDGSLAARIVTDGFSLDVDSAKDKAAFSISRDGMRVGYSKDGARTQASFGTDQFALGYDTQNNRVQAGFSNGIVAAQYDRSDKRLKAGFTTQMLAVKVDESASKRTLSFDGRLTAVRSADERSGTLNGWVSGQFVRNTGENSQTDVFAGRVGMHRFTSRDSLTGFVLTADSANGTFQRDGFDEDSKVSSRGYMLGIYHGSKVSLSGRALKLDLQGHFGSTNNTVTTPGGDTGSFGGSRAMLSGRASVDMLLSSGTTLSPYVQGHYLSQSTEKFTTTGGTEVDALSLSFVDLSAGARFGYRNAETDTRFGFEPSVVYRVNSSDEDDEKANQLRGKVSADMSVPLASGRLSSRVFYEGIGVENSTSYGGSIQYERNF